MARKDYIDSNGVSRLWNNAKTKFVTKETGKGLSTNDYTDAEKSKLNGIQSEAEANVLEGVQVNGTDLVVVAKKVNIDLSNYATKSDISHIYKPKGSVATYADLPSSGMEDGDTYNVQTADPTHDVKAGDNLAWIATDDGGYWDNLSGIIDMSAYATITAMNTALANKVDKVNGKGLSTNDYTTNEKNKLAGIAAGAEVNVQSDWNQTNSSAKDFIKNKPTIPAQITVDSALSSTSTNPVQNKVINSALAEKINSSDLVALTNAEIDALCT